MECPTDNIAPIDKLGPDKVIISKDALTNLLNYKNCKKVFKDKFESNKKDYTLMLKNSTPLTIFIIICVFCLICMIIYRTMNGSVPSIFNVSSHLFIMLSACVVLLLIGGISINLEWYLMIICVLFITMMMMINTHPDIFFYSAYS